MLHAIDNLYEFFAVPISVTEKLINAKKRSKFDFL